MTQYSPINLVTGTITTAELTINSSDTLDDVQSWPACISVEPTNENEGWFAATLREQMIEGASFFVSMLFHHGRLWSVSLSNTDPEFGTSWDDWSEEKQLALKEWHSAWLLRVTGKERAGERWGGFESLYDSKGGFSLIHIRYV